MNISVAGIAKKGLPAGFLYADEVVEDAIIDAKYAGTDNFLGVPVDGYFKPLVVVTREIAEPLVCAADELRARGYLVKLYDSYRPQRAVDHFVRWAADADDCRRKPVHYPGVPEKRMMFELGYIARRSGHTRGCAVDLTLVDMVTHQELDMGSIFDFMDPRSHPDAEGLSPLQRENRALLSGVMLPLGFRPNPCEWWHFSLQNEPYPDTYFDFLIE